MEVDETSETKKRVSYVHFLYTFMYTFTESVHDLLLVCFVCIDNFYGFLTALVLSSSGLGRHLPVLVILGLQALSLSSPISRSLKSFIVKSFMMNSFIVKSFIVKSFIVKSFIMKSFNLVSDW